VLCGVVLGLQLAMAAAQTIRSLLYGLVLLDPSTLIVVTFTIIGVAGLAGYLPARRASRLDPMVALRYE
jgi:ABC-type antimicrobial peptide transport system permease subunit